MKPGMLAFASVVLAAAPALAQEAAPAPPPQPTAPAPRLEVATDGGKTLSKQDERCAERKWACKGSKGDSYFGLAFFGVRVDRTNTSHAGVAGDGQTSVQAGLSFEALTNAGLSNTHALHEIAIGGGGAGFDGMWRGVLTGGVRPAITEGQGPFARLGLSWQIGGNDRYYASYLELPRVEVGYDIGLEPLSFEVGARGGAVLTGALHVDDVRRSLGTNLDAGGFAMIGVTGLRVRGEVFRVFSDDDRRRPVDVWNGSACFAYGLAVCGDVAYYHTRGVAGVDPAAPITGLAATYVGVSVGVGATGSPTLFGR